MLSERGMFVAEKRILAKDKNGNVIETPEQMFKRVADALGKSKQESKEFFDVMSNLYFLPNSPCLVNAGLPDRLQNLSACFVLPLEDSIDSIYDTMKQTALIHKCGGGTGFNFSNLRPRNSIVKSTKGVASGVVSFMKVYDASTGGIKQGGVRRGANIGILNIEHPDIEEFIQCKNVPGDLTNFNISVAITDKFMEAVFHDQEIQLHHPKAKPTKVKARKLWNMIVKSAHSKGDPGILFIDEINKCNPLKGKDNLIEATNPCQPGWTPIHTSEGLKPLAMVHIGDKIWSAEGWTTVINKRCTGVKTVRAYMTANGIFYSTPNHKVISDGFKVEVKDATYLDAISGPDEKCMVHKTQLIISESFFSEEPVYSITVDNSSHTYWSFGFNTGNCGEVPLSANEVCCLGSVNVSAMITDTGNINYPLLHSTVVTGVKLLNRLIDKSEYPSPVIEAKVKASRKIGLGVMGVADAFIKLKIPYSSGEALEYMEDLMQNILDSCVGATNELGKKEGCFEAISNYVPPHHIKQALARLNIPESAYKPRNATLTTIAPTGTLSMLADCSSGIEPVFYFKQKENRVDEERSYVHPLYAAFRAQYPKIHLPTYFQEAHDIPIDAHLQMQATCQQYVCNAVSKTINLPRGASVDDVEKVYKEAFLLGCKGVTVYVDGSLDGQTLSRDGSTAKSSRIGHIKPLKRPEMLSGSTFEINTGFGPLFITVNNYDEKPFEVLCNIGKSGASENAKAEACGRLISLALRCGISLQHIIEQISGIVGGTAQHTEYGLVTSIPDAIAKVLTNKVLKSATTFKSVGMRRCPDCDSSELHYEGACLICSTCGWKSCGN